MGYIKWTYCIYKINTVIIQENCIKHFLKRKSQIIAFICKFVSSQRWLCTFQRTCTSKWNNLALFYPDHVNSITLLLFGFWNSQEHFRKSNTNYINFLTYQSNHLMTVKEISNPFLKTWLSKQWKTLWLWDAFKTLVRLSDSTCELWLNQYQWDYLSGWTMADVWKILYKNKV